MDVELADRVKTEMFETVRKYSPHSDIDLGVSTIIGDLGIDSIDLMEIIFEVEEKHGVEIDETQLANLSNLGEIVELAVSTIKAGA